MTDYVESIIRGISLLMIWACCAFPLWNFLISDVGISPLVFGPFIINIISLIGSHSFESHAVDWRVLVWNYFSAGCFSMAALLTSEWSWTGAAIVGVATGVSVVASLTRFQANHKFMRQLDRRVTGAKVLFLTAPMAVLIWALVDKYPTRENMGIDIIIQMLLALPILGGCILTFLFPMGTKCGDVGVGNPLLWIAARLVLAGAAQGFWAWLLYCVLCFMVLQLGRDRQLWPSIGFFWNGIQNAELKTSSITLSLSIYQLILTLQSPLCKACVTNRQMYSDLLSHVIDAQAFLNEGIESACPPTFWWRSEAMLNVSRYLEPSRQFYEKVQGHDHCFTHYMYEQTGAIIVMILLLTCSLMYMLRRIKGMEGDQGFWQPIFFISSAIVSMLYFRNEEEIWAIGDDTLTIIWSQEAITALGISLFGACFSSFIALFRLRNLKLIRLATDNDIATIENAGGILLETLLPIGLLCYAIIVSWLMIFHVIPGRGYGLDVDSRQSIVNFVQPLDDISLLMPFSERILQLRIPGPDLCANYSDCHQTIEDFESLVPGNCSLDFNLTFLAQIIHEASQGHNFSFRFGLADLMRTELWITCLMSMAVLLMVLISTWLPLIEDMALTFLLATAAVLAVAIPFKLGELREFKIVEAIPEWGMSTLCMAILASCGILFHIRIRRTISFLMPFQDADDIMERFQNCTSELDSFLDQYFPGIDKSTAWTWDMLYDEMVRRSRAKSTLVPRAEQVPLYTSSFHTAAVGIVDTREG